MVESALTAFMILLAPVAALARSRRLALRAWLGLILVLSLLWWSLGLLLVALAQLVLGGLLSVWLTGRPLSGEERR